MMRRVIFVGATILVTQFSIVDAVAQSTTGELLDAGGVKLSKEEVATALDGATVTGTLMNGATFEYKYNADGSFSGAAYGSIGNRVGVVGTWAVDENGKICAERHLSGTRGRDQYCSFYLSISDQYYESYSQSDLDRKALIYKRTIKK